MDKSDNKMMTPDIINASTGYMTKYMFPDYGVSIDASSIEEAQKKLADFIKSND